MKVLVLETDPGAADHAIERLRTAGHEVVRCHEPRGPAFPCSGLEVGRCPLDEGVSVVLTVRAHPLPRPAPLEDGVTCALRHRVPVVVAGKTALHPFDRWAAAVVDADDDTDVVAACERVARQALPGHQAMAESALADALAAVGESPSGWSVTVERAPGGVAARIHPAPGAEAATANRVVVMVVGRVRAFDSAAGSVHVHLARSSALDA